MWRGVFSALAAAFCFGLSAPFSKLLLEHLSALWLAALLFLGAGLGSALLLAGRRLLGRPAEGTPLPWRWFAPSILCGMLGPLFISLGLERCGGTQGALLLNLELPFTAALAWVVFREPCGRRGLAGMALLVAGGVVLALQPDGSRFDLSWGALAIAGACLAWAVDNNLIKKFAQADPLRSVAIKGIIGGALLALAARAAGQPVPSPAPLAEGLLLGFVSYGWTLYGIMYALRVLGAARMIAYFSVAPFLGALLSLWILGERADLRLGIAAVLMAAGLWVTFSEQRAHIDTPDTSS